MATTTEVEGGSEDLLLCGGVGLGRSNVCRSLSLSLSLSLPRTIYSVVLLLGHCHLGHQTSSEFAIQILSRVTYRQTDGTRLSM